MPDFSTLLLAEPVMVFAYGVFGMVGFGSTLVGAPLLAHLFPLTTVVPVFALSDMVASWTNGWQLSQHVARRELYRLLPGLFAGSALGAWLLFTLPLNLLMPMLGGFVVLYALHGLRPQGANKFRVTLGVRWAWGFGVVGGIFSALFGAGGWVYASYLVHRLEEPQQIRATQSAVLMCSSLVRVGLFIAAGRLIEADLLLLVVTLLPGLALGLYLGHRISLRLDRRRFLLLVHWVLLFTGSSLVLRAWLAPN